MGGLLVIGTLVAAVAQAAVGAEAKMGVVRRGQFGGMAIQATGLGRRQAAGQ
jgi:hypothetical protein